MLKGSTNACKEQQAPEMYEGELGDKVLISPVCFHDCMCTHMHGMCAEVRGQPQSYSSGVFHFLPETRLLDGLEFLQVD